MSKIKGFETIPKKCEKCENFLPERAKRFCGYECYWESKRMVPNLVICKRCKKEYYYRKTNHTHYCSKKCRNEKYRIDHHYFSELTPEKIQTLGMIIACGWHSAYNLLRITADLKTIEKISMILSSEYKITKSVRGLSRIVIASEDLVGDLIKLGLSNDPMLQELPFYDFDLLLEGIKQTHSWDGTGFRFNSPRLAMEIAERLGYKIRENWYKNIPRGRISVEYYVSP